jgi:hypothetical protein
MESNTCICGAFRHPKSYLGLPSLTGTWNLIEMTLKHGQEPPAASLLVNTIKQTKKCIIFEMQAQINTIRVVILRDAVPHKIEKGTQQFAL